MICKFRRRGKDSFLAKPKGAWREVEQKATEATKKFLTLLASFSSVNVFAFSAQVGDFPHAQTGETPVLH